MGGTLGPPPPPLLSSVVLSLRLSLSLLFSLHLPLSCNPSPPFPLHLSTSLSYTLPLSLSLSPPHHFLHVSSTLFLISPQRQLFPSLPPTCTLTVLTSWELCIHLCGLPGPSTWQSRDCYLPPSLSGTCCLLLSGLRQPIYPEILL